MTRAVHFVVPEGVDDPLRATGGNVFDSRVAQGLAAIGWDVRMTHVDRDAATAVSRLPDGALVLIDGLIASRAADAIAAAAGRMRIVILAHMVAAAFADADPCAVQDERRALHAARRVIATSEWTRSELIHGAGVAPERVVVAIPGSDEAPVSRGTPAGAALLCVGVVAPHKGQDVLVEALAGLGTKTDWTCTIAGSLDARPDYAEHIGALAARAGLRDRVRLTGALAGGALDRAYRGADLVVAPSRVESYGMAIADALRRGIPVVASSVGGIPQTVAARAAVLVPPDRPQALRAALQRWMTDPGLRERLTDQARRGRAGLPSWSATVARIADILAEA